MKTIKLTKVELNSLSTLAWRARKNSFVLGNTKVGACLLSNKGQYYTGCNVEHIFRSHDIHAEVNAISNMIVGGERRLKAILIVAMRSKFTPCGSCMDWIMQHGGKNCIVGFQNKKGGEIIFFRAGELMPHYPS